MVFRVGLRIVKDDKNARTLNIIHNRVIQYSRILGVLWRWHKKCTLSSGILPSQHPGQVHMLMAIDIRGSISSTWGIWGISGKVDSSTICSACDDTYIGHKSINGIWASLTNSHTIILDYTHMERAVHTHVHTHINVHTSFNTKNCTHNIQM